MKKLFVMLLCAACHHEIKQALDIDTATKLTRDNDIHSIQLDDTKKAEQEFFHKVIEPMVGDTDIALDVDATPTTPAKHFKLHAHNEGGKTVIESGVKKQEQEKEVSKLDDKSKLKTETAARAKLKTDEVTDSGPGWKFYLTIIAIAALVLGAGLVVLKYKLWRLL